MILAILMGVSISISNIFVAIRYFFNTVEIRISSNKWFDISNTWILISLVNLDRIRNLHKRMNILYVILYILYVIYYIFYIYYVLDLKWLSSFLKVLSTESCLKQFKFFTTCKYVSTYILSIHDKTNFSKFSRHELINYLN